jgi:hypothetical protein
LITYSVGTDVKVDVRSLDGPEIPSTSAVASPLSVADELPRLAALRDQGLLTDEEYAAQKAKLLGQ